MRNNRMYVFRLVLTAMMAALCMLLGRLDSVLSLSIGFKIGFPFLPVAVAAILCGPLDAALAWVIGDLIGALCFPTGVFHPGFTIIYGLMGLTYGLFLHCKKLGWWRVALPALITCLLELFANTLWLSQIWHTSYWVLFIGRLTLKCPIQFLMNVILIPPLFVLCKKLGKNRGLWA